MRQIVTALAVIALGIATAMDGLKPVALSVLADGNLLILFGDHLEIREPTTGKRRTSVAIPGMTQWIDATATGPSDRPGMFLVGRGSKAGGSMIAQYNLQGKEVRSWRLKAGYPSGIAFDPSRQVLYVTELQTPTVHTINLAEKESVARYLAGVRGASRLGSITVGPEGQLFVADLFSGTIYRLSPPAYRATVLVSDLGEPSAMAVGPGGRILYVSDRSQRCVWSIRLDTATPRPTKFWVNELRSPSSVGVSANGTVWIGDPGAQAVFGVSPEGTMIRVIR